MKFALVIINSELKRCDRCDINLNGSVYKNIKIALQHRKKYYCVRCMTRLSHNLGQKVTDKELDDFYNKLINNQTEFDVIRKEPNSCTDKRGLN